MLEHALSDPETAVLLRRALTGPVLPFVAGVCSGNQTNGRIPKFCDASQTPPTLDDSVMLEITNGVTVVSAPAYYFGRYSGSDYAVAGIDNNGLINIGSGATGPTGIGFFPGSSQKMKLTTSGNLGIGTASPTNILSFGGTTARTVWMERHTTNNTAGNSLTVQAGGATSGATDKSGGDLILQSGIATGSGLSKIVLQAPASGSSGSADRSFSTRMEVGEATLTDLEGITTRTGSRLYQVGLGTPAQQQSTALYLEVDQGGGTDQIFGIIGEVKNTQDDKYGGFLKIAHKGAGDAIFIPLFTAGGVALEAASNADGTKGIISTIQDTVSNPQNCTLFNGLWQNSNLPLYGMFYADESPGNGLTIRKRVAGVTESNPQIRIWDFDPDASPTPIDRNRFEAFNDGGVRLSSPTASGSPQNSPLLRLRGADASNDREVKLQNVVTGSEQYRLSVQDGSGVEKAAVTNDGELWLKAHSGFADSQSITTTAAITTTNATRTTLAAITLADGRAYEIVVKVLARKSDGSERAFYWRAALAYRQGGNATIEGGSPAGVVSLATVESSGAVSGNWDATLDASGNDVRVRVTGQASTTIYWVVTIQYQSVATSS